jgi:hypothetical protein
LYEIKNIARGHNKYIINTYDISISKLCLNSAGALVYSTPEIKRIKINGYNKNHL